MGSIQSMVFRMWVIVCLSTLLGTDLLAQTQISRHPQKCISGEQRALYRDMHPDLIAHKEHWPTEKTTLSPKYPTYDYVIPVVVHVMHDNGPELNVDMTRVNEQIEVLNEDFGRYGNGENTHPDGADVRIKFCLASKDPEGSPTTGLNYVYYPPAADINPFNLEEDTLMKREMQWDPNRYLNIYVVRQISGGQLFGYAFYPDEVAGTIYDGVVIDYRSFGRPGGGVFGRTGTHEVGHYLGLIHTWGDGDCALDDEVEDTPRCADPFYSSQPSCDNTIQCGGVRQIENYMDYSDDACMNMFTVGQATRMRKAIINYRYELVSSQNLPTTGCGETLDTLTYSQGFYIYPNPAYNKIIVYNDIIPEELIDIWVIDAAGRKVYEEEQVDFVRGPIVINMESMMKGMYYVMIRSDSRTLRTPVAVLR